MGRTPGIEKLEDRKLLASITMVAHVLSITGQSVNGDTITVGLLPDGASVYATYSYPTKKGIVTKTKSYAPGKIHLVKINGGAKSDLITINQTNGAFPASTIINTHAGNDIVVAGDEADKITCGNGLDSVTSGNGNDTLIAGTHADTLIGGNGNDQLRSGRGHDIMIAGDGSNVFTDPYGYVTLQGGAGHDTYVLKNIALDPVNDYSTTKDTLRKYVPPSAKDNTLKDILNGILDSGFF